MNFTEFWLSKKNKKTDSSLRQNTMDGCGAKEKEFSDADFSSIYGVRETPRFIVSLNDTSCSNRAIIVGVLFFSDPWIRGNAILVFHNHLGSNRAFVTDAKKDAAFHGFLWGTWLTKLTFCEQLMDVAEKDCFQREGDSDVSTFRNVRDTVPLVFSMLSHHVSLVLTDRCETSSWRPKSLGVGKVN